MSLTSRVAGADREFDWLRSSRTAAVVLAVAAVLPALWATFGDLPFVVSILVEVMIFAVFAMGFNLLVGYTGYVSFGHTVFLGAGAYGTALLVAKVGLPFVLAALVALAGTAVFSLLVAHVSFRRSGVYFAMITLGVSQVVYTLFQSWDYVGGTTGVTIDPPTVLGYTFNPFDPLGYYYLALAGVVATYLFLRSVVRSPFGHVLQAIRENEERAAAVGYDVRRFKLGAFTVSGTVSGFAGVLYAAYFTQVGPGSTLYWTTTGDGLFMILIGGMGTLVGPLIGAAFVVGVRYGLSTYLAGAIPAAAPELVHRIPDRYPLLLGIVFMFVVLRFRDGIAGAVGFSKTRGVAEALAGTSRELTGGKRTTLAEDDAGAGGPGGNVGGGASDATGDDAAASGGEDA